MPKTKEAKKIAVDALPELRPDVYKFIELRMFDPSVDGNASQAYRLAFPDSTAQPETIHRMASRLKNTDDVQMWIRQYKLAQMDRLDKSRNQYLADLEKDIEEAKAAGNYGAAISARKLQGSVLGHMNADAKNPRDAENNIKDLVWMYQNVDEKAAIKLAKETGLYSKFQKELETVH